MCRPQKSSTAYITPGEERRSYGIAVHDWIGRAG
jgi:hypothetical protein